MTADVAASVRARLLNQAKARREEFERTLSRFAGERFLFRLGASDARERCILKGASLLAVWMPDPYRATRDIDVLATGSTDDEAIRRLLSEICAVDCVEDGVRFDLSELVVDAIRAEDEFVGRRARFHAYLGQARIAMQVDFGVGDALAVEPQHIVYPTNLTALPAPRVRAYPREQAVAEKFEAMVVLGTRNSRMKDFHDVWALFGAFDFDGALLRRSVAACFERRKTPWDAEIPAALTPAFYEHPQPATRWKHYLAAGAVITPPPREFAELGERVRQFLVPVYGQLGVGGVLTQRWKKGGPWTAPSTTAE
ncbi:MAG: nucleotidyl transferase AbiEii/AbiGii toxin family protein [Gemmatimonadetes bacterium]|nr:nucleotidyl transferase AbiEii/AbiGii toxin family protein [Gemmatimonadota bacterium]